MFSCHSKTERQMNIPAVEDKKITDPSYIFNGVSLDGWEKTDFVLPGSVYIENGEILMEMGDGCTGITWTGDPPVMDYQLSLDAKRVDGHDFFCGLTFPVNEYYCTLILGGWGGSFFGLSCIDGFDASDNETTGRMHFEKNKWYHITLEVSNGKIKTIIDDQIVIDFTIGNHYLSVRSEVSYNIPLGFASWNTTTAFKNIRLIRNFNS